MDAYLHAADDELERQRHEAALHPSPAVQRLWELARQRDEQRSLLSRR
jgi:hypothetical protein